MSMGSENREPTDYERHLNPIQSDKQLRRRRNDSAPQVGGTVPRKNQGRNISRTVVTQLSPGLEAGLPQDVSQVNTGRKLKSPTPTEILGQQAAEGYQDPVTLKAARRQLFAKGLLHKRGRHGRQTKSR